MLLSKHYEGLRITLIARAVRPTQPAGENEAGVVVVDRRRVLLTASSVFVYTLAGLPLAALAARAPVSSLRVYKTTLVSLARQYPAALIDIGAEWCAVCKRIDREILSHPAVQELLRRIAIVKIDVTAMDQESRRLLGHLRASGPPTLFIVETATGREYAHTRSVGFFPVKDLIRRLRPFAA